MARHDTALITVGAVRATLTAARDTKRFVNNLLTVADDDKRWSYRYRRGASDATVELLVRPGNTFPTGLVPRVAKALRDDGVRVTITPEIAIPTPEPFADVLRDPRDPSQPITLRDHQTRGADLFMRYRRLSEQAPTGSGKTALIAECIRRLGLPTLVVMHKKDLLVQTQRELATMLALPVGLIGAGRFEPELPVTVATVQTLSRYLDVTSFWHMWYALIGDEMHRGSSTTWLDVAGASVNAFWRLAVSATLRNKNPLRDMQLEGAFGPLVVVATTPELEAQGLLAKTSIDLVQLPPSCYPTYAAVRDAVCPEWQDNPQMLRQMGGRLFARMYRAGIVTNRTRNADIVDRALAAQAAGHKVLVPVIADQHGQILAQEFGRAALRVYGADTMRTRLAAKAHLAKPGGRIVVASDIWREGVDTPDVSRIIMACGGESTIGTLQRIGRGKRPDTDLVVTDYYDGRTNRADAKDYLRRHARQRLADYRAEHYRIHIVEQFDRVI